MIKDFTVRQEIMDRNTGATHIKVYPFDKYTARVSSDLKMVLSDLETMISKAYNDKPSSEWEPEIQEMFQRCRKRLLNSFNNVQRLPNTMCYRGVPCANLSISEWLDQMNITGK